MCGEERSDQDSGSKEFMCEQVNQMRWAGMKSGMRAEKLVVNA